jgi:prepilin-type processing-associated H-X9-DG protein
MRCQGHLKQLMLSIHNYESYFGEMPKGTLTVKGGCEHRDPRGWLAASYMQMNEHRFSDPRAFATDLNRIPLAERFSSFTCDSSRETRAAVTNYVALAGVGLDAATLPAKTAGIGFMGNERSTRTIDFVDGMSNTIALIETDLSLGPWARGGPASLRPLDPDDATPFGRDRAFGGLHSMIVNVAFADGSVRSLRETLSPMTFAAMITIAGGEPIPIDE